MNARKQWMLLHAQAEDNHHIHKQEEEEEAMNKGRSELDDKERKMNDTSLTLISDLYFALKAAVEDVLEEDLSHRIKRSRVDARPCAGEAWSRAS